MGHFHALPDAVAVAADRLVAVVRVGSDGGVVVRATWLMAGCLRSPSRDSARRRHWLIRLQHPRHPWCTQLTPSGSLPGAAKR